MAILQIGDIIRRRREELGYTQEELAAGICSVPTLSRIENGERIPQKNILDQLLQQLGYSNMSVDVWTDEKNFQLHNLKFQIRQAIIMDETEKAKTLLRKFERLYSPSDPVDHQFMLLYQTMLYGSPSSAERKKQLEKALLLTCPFYNEKKLPRVMAYEEIILVNNIAICYWEEGSRDEAIELLYQLKESYERNVVNIEEALRTQLLILYNLSKFLGLEGRYDECIEICDLGIQIAVRTGRCHSLPGILYNRAWSLVKRGQEGDLEEAKRPVVQAFQLANILGKTAMAQHIRAFIEENFKDAASLIDIIET